MPSNGKSRTWFREFRLSLRQESTRPSKKPRRLSMENLEGRRVLTALPYGATELDLGEFMLGNVAVTPVFLESNGQRDANTETWTQQQITDTLAKIDEGLDWWVDALATKSSIHELNFSVDTTYASTPAETSYEPISRRSNDYALYVPEFLESVGFDTAGSLELNIRAFNHSQRVKANADWSFTMFVVPSENDADGQFASGGSFSRAFAFAGGLFMIVPSTRPASTFAHETAHIFWGRDEYPGGGTYFQRRGYYNTQNLNAHDNPTPGFVQQPSIMASSTLLDTAYQNHISPDSTFAMLGWQDSDGDGIFDLADVPHRLTGTGYLDPSNSTYRFVGSATVQALPNLNPSGLGNDITINKIREIEYRFDGGPWQLHSTPDANQVNLDLTINVPSNVSEIEIRARDSKTTVISNTFSGRLSQVDSTPVSGINGAVWIDINKNNLRDVGEYGQEFWTVDLVDNSGNLLDLRRAIEPDDYPNGQLSSGFSQELTLNAVGTDADGRVGVFPDSLASTGSKNFWAFSRGAQSYLSSWNSETRRLEINFANPTSVVSIDAIGSSNGSFGRIDAYNSADELIARYTTSALDFEQVETMMISRGQNDIARIIVGGHANSTVRLDNMQYGPETSVATGPQGQFAIGSLPAGNYNVRVTPTSQFVATNPSGGQQSVTVSANTATTDIDFGFQSSTSDWQNSGNVHDVNNDSVVSAIDVLFIVNDINQNGTRDLRGTGLTPPPFIDVSGDNFVSAIDVLLVVNFINGAGNGQGEGIPAWNSDSGNLSFVGKGNSTGNSHPLELLGEGEASAGNVNSNPLDSGRGNSPFATDRFFAQPDVDYLPSNLEFLPEQPDLATPADGLSLPLGELVKRRHTTPPV